MTNIDEIMRIKKNDAMSIMNDIDKKIILKTYKERNKHKTVLFGIGYFIDNDKGIEGFTKLCRQKLGCSGTISTDENNKTLITFSGDHVDTLKQLLIDEKITSEQYIKC